MRSNHKNKDKSEVGMELKYCEHCGGLWVRERSAGVYCENCQAKVADLPKPTKKGRNPLLPVGAHTAVEDYEFEVNVEDISDFDAAGGLA